MRVDHRGGADAHVLVMAKEPVPGRVKTRLCPPLDHEQAARVARACLTRTLTQVTGCSAPRKLLALDGEPGGWIPPGFTVFAQKGETFAERLSNAWSEAGAPGLQIGMDTPQVTSEQLDRALRIVTREQGSAVLGLAADGGWWCIGTSRPWPFDVFSPVSMSTDRTGAEQLQVLRGAGYRVSLLDVLRDVDTIEDALAVKGLVSDERFQQEMTDAGLVSVQDVS